MPVPAGYGLRPLDLSEQVAATRDVEALEGKRQQEFRDWMKNRLRHMSARVEEEESRRKQLEVSNKQLEVSNKQLRSRLQALEGRLEPFQQLQTLAAAQQQELTQRQQEINYLRTEPLHALLWRRARAWLRSRPRPYRTTDLEAPRAKRR
jgi:predicted RNase H-like nuclease (RuvC/YqgF family)